MVSVVAYDLPIAIGILLSSEQVGAECDEFLFLGELSLDGGLRHTHGILPMVALAKEKGMEAVFALSTASSSLPALSPALPTPTSLAPLTLLRRFNTDRGEEGSLVL